MSEGRKRLLDPSARSSEILFGLIMALTFTGSFGVAGAGREDVRTMLLGALGCNLAWGIVDACMYLMGVMGERGGDLRKVRAVRAAADAVAAREAVRAALAAPVARALGPEELDVLGRAVSRIPDPGGPARPDREDWQAALGVFLLVVVATFPVVVPFLVVRDPWTALRASNGVAIAMLFLLGWGFGRAAGYRPLATGASMVALGLALVALTIALGG